MEEKVHSLLNTIWEQSLNPEDEELLLKKLHKICFKDPLKTDQISNPFFKLVFLCSRLINSDQNLLKFLESECGDKDKKSTSFRRKIIEFLKEFIVFFSQNCIEYLEYLKVKFY
jgi:hypothetical protein